MRRRPVVEGPYATFTGGQASLLRPSPPDGSNGDGVSHHRSSRVSSAARLVRMARRSRCSRPFRRAGGGERPTGGRRRAAAGPDAGSGGPARWPCKGRRLDGHRRPPQERWSATDRRAAAYRRHPGTDPLRDAGRGTHPVGPDAPPVRPAAGLREHDRGQSSSTGRPPSRRPRRTTRSTTARRWSSASSPNDPATSSATSICCRT